MHVYGVLRILRNCGDGFVHGCWKPWILEAKNKKPKGELPLACKSQFIRTSLACFLFFPGGGACSIHHICLPGMQMPTAHDLRAMLLPGGEKASGELCRGQAAKSAPGLNQQTRGSRNSTSMRPGPILIILCIVQVVQRAANTIVALSWHACAGSTLCTPMPRQRRYPR